MCYLPGKHCKGPNHNPRKGHVTGEAAYARETNAVGLFMPSITYVCIINSKIKDNLKLCFPFYSLEIPIFLVPNQFPAKENEFGKRHLVTFRKFRPFLLDRRRLRCASFSGVTGPIFPWSSLSSLLPQALHSLPEAPAASSTLLSSISLALLLLLENLTCPAPRPLPQAVWPCLSRSPGLI